MICPDLCVLSCTDDFAAIKRDCWSDTMGWVKIQKLSHLLQSADLYLVHHHNVKSLLTFVIVIVASTAKWVQPSSSSSSSVGPMIKFRFCVAFGVIHCLTEDKMQFLERPTIRSTAVISPLFVNLMQLVAYITSTGKTCESYLGSERSYLHETNSQIMDTILSRSVTKILIAFRIWKIIFLFTIW